VTGACDCLSEGKVITSEVTFRTNAVSARDMTLTCGNGRTEQRNLSVSVEGLQTPHLNYTTIAADKDVLNVSVTWTTEDSDKKDIEYVLSVSADSLSQNKSTTTNRKQNLTLFNGTEYTITVISQRCGGDLTSNTSDPKHILFPVITPTVGALDTRSIDVAVAASVPAALVALALLALIPVVVYCICSKKAHEKVMKSGTKQYNLCV
jgi:hypothetical protein